MKSELDIVGATRSDASLFAFMQEYGVNVTREPKVYTVQCLVLTPRVFEDFHTFHSAYLYAYQLAESKDVAVQLLNSGTHIMTVMPDRRVVWM